METKNRKLLIVLDSLKYQIKEGEIRADVSKDFNLRFYYTYYENRLIKLFHSLPVIGNFLTHITYWSISLIAAIKIFIAMKDIKSKIFINPIVAIFYCAIVNIFRRTENIIIAGFLFEDKRNKTYLKLRKAFVNYSYKRVSKIVVYSKNEVELYSKWFPNLAPKFLFIRYGRDFDIFEERVFEVDKPYVASGGVSNRDFSTLLKAFKTLEVNVPGVACKIATRPQACNSSDAPNNVEVLYNVRIDTFGSFLANSLFVVIPLANTFLSAGHMALLEAMYRGKIIVITDISAVRDYVDDSLVYFYNPEDEIDLAAKIEYVYHHSAGLDATSKAIRAKEYYDLHYSFSRLLRRIVDILV
jgi:glycosyltransferase involved in cell wall biosynthesis